MKHVQLCHEAQGRRHERLSKSQDRNRLPAQAVMTLLMERFGFESRHCPHLEESGGGSSELL
jgi:hypothetical protein